MIPFYLVGMKMTEMAMSLMLFIHVRGLSGKEDFKSGAIECLSIAIKYKAVFSL